MSARSYALDKRKRQQMAKSPAKNGPFVTVPSAGGMAKVKPYVSGSNVARGKKPAPGAGGIAPAAESKGRGLKNRKSS